LQVKSAILDVIVTVETSEERNEFIEEQSDPAWIAVSYCLVLLLEQLMQESRSK
jgi:hypothetical protein